MMGATPNFMVEVVASFVPARFMQAGWTGKLILAEGIVGPPDPDRALRIRGARERGLS